MSRKAAVAILVWLVALTLTVVVGGVYVVALTAPAG